MDIGVDASHLLSTALQIESHPWSKMSGQTNVTHYDQIPVKCFYIVCFIINSDALLLSNLVVTCDQILFCFHLNFSIL